MIIFELIIIIKLNKLKKERKRKNQKKSKNGFNESFVDEWETLFN